MQVSNSAYGEPPTNLGPNPTGGAFSGGANLLINLFRTGFAYTQFEQMKADLQRITPEVQSALDSQPDTGGVLVSIATSENGSREFSIKTYEHTDVVPARTPTEALGRDRVEPAADMHTNIWVSNICPADLPAGVVFMTPEQFARLSQ